MESGEIGIINWKDKSNGKDKYYINLLREVIKIYEDLNLNSLEKIFKHFGIGIENMIFLGPYYYYDFDYKDLNVRFVFNKNNNNGYILKTADIFDKESYFIGVVELD